MLFHSLSSPPALEWFGAGGCHTKETPKTGGSITLWRALSFPFRNHGNVDTNPTPVKVIAISALAPFVCAPTLFQISQMGHLDSLQIIKCRGREMSSWSSVYHNAKAHATMNMKPRLFDFWLPFQNLTAIICQQKKNNTQSWLQTIEKKIALVSYVTTPILVFFLSLMCFERWLLDSSVTRTPLCIAPIMTKCTGSWLKW